MSVPDYQGFMQPFLVLMGDGGEHSLQEAYEVLPERLGLSEEDIKAILPSGKQAVYKNRIGWARTYLKKAGLLETVRRGVFRITERGKEVLREGAMKIDADYLMRFEGFREFKEGKTKEVDGGDGGGEGKNPEEVLEYAYEEMNRQLGEDILEVVKGSTPGFFEKLVIDLLLKMGYGGSRKDAGEAMGKTGDEGIDGIIKEDRLGLDVIYVQAKRWENVVGRPEIQKFAGALQGQRARKGVFITTSGFSKEAEAFARSIENKIILVDGEMLTQLMIEHNVGVSVSGMYEVKKIDGDYFEE